MVVDNPAPVISLCFDDFPVSAYDNGVPLLDNYGVKATFYISLGLTGKMTHTGVIASYEMIEQLLSQGHEIGCHTFDHSSAWKISPRQYEESIVKNRKLFQTLFPGSSMHTFAFPYGSATYKAKKIAEKHFVCSRGTYWGINTKKIDLNILKSCHLSCTNGTAQEKQRIIKEVIEKTAEKKGWALFYIHDIQDNPTNFGCPPGFLESFLTIVHEYNIPVLPVYDAYVKIKSGQVNV